MYNFSLCLLCFVPLLYILFFWLTCCLSFPRNLHSFLTPVSFLIHTPITEISKNITYSKRPVWISLPRSHPHKYSSTVPLSAHYLNYDLYLCDLCIGVSHLAYELHVGSIFLLNMVSQHIGQILAQGCCVTHICCINLWLKM